MPIIVRSRHPAGQWVEETAETRRAARERVLALEEQGFHAEIWHICETLTPPKPRNALAETAFR